MRPLFFGPRDRRLYAVYTPAQGERTRRGVVLCPPAGQEYLRSHRSSVLLAKLFTKAGHDVLRFDYFGTGDSAGASTTFTVTGAIEDTAAAVQEISDIASVPSVTLVGLRLGGAIAAAASEQAPRVDRLVLWDPTLDGPAYAKQLRDEGDVLGGGEGIHTRGFSFSEAALREIEGLADLEPTAFPAKVLIACSEERPEHRQLSTQLSQAGVDVGYEVAPFPSCWTEQGDTGKGAVPLQTLKAIARW